MSAASKPATRRVKWAGRRVAHRKADPLGHLLEPGERSPSSSFYRDYRCITTEGASTTVPVDAQLYAALCTDALGSLLALGPFLTVGAVADVVAAAPGIRVREVVALNSGSVATIGGAR